MKPAPQLPPEMMHWHKQQRHQALVNILAHNLGPAVYSDLLKQQLTACCTGLQTAKRNFAEIESDELATRYQQIYDEEIASAKAILEDHILVFFVACQLYVTRVVEAVRWFKTLEGGSPDGQTKQLPRKFFELKSDISGNPRDLRQFGTADIKGMTIAECMWHLGNYAKHNDEMEDFSEETKRGLEKLDICNTDDGVVPDAIRRGLQSVTGSGIVSIEDIAHSLEQIVTFLKFWAEQLEGRIISDLDEYFLADPNYTRRLNDSFQRNYRSQDKEL